MTRIYLDVNDRVRVDRTPNAEHANRAETARGLLKLYARLERFSSRTINLLEAKGKSSASARSILEQIHLACADIRVDAS
jgi:hypothetical protein